MKTDIIVMGSITIDTYLHVEDFPKYGQGVEINTIDTMIGGKGANQAVAANNQNVDTIFIGAIGNDNSGEDVLSELEERNIDTTYILKKENEMTGNAIAVVDKNGENTFLVKPGANKAISKKDVHQIFDTIQATTLLLQLEIKQEATQEALKIAHERGMKVILDPAPEASIYKESVQYADIVTPNEKEAGVLAGLTIHSINDAKTAAKKISDLGVKTVVIKLGERGSLLYEKDENHFSYINPYKVKVENTVGAGDTFAGVLAAKLNMGKTSIVEAIKYATAASALKISRNDGQDAIPTEKEIEMFISDSK